MLLTREAARRHILRRHGLSRDRFPSPEIAMRAVVAVQSQYPASVGPALAARANGADSKWLDSALTKRRSVLKGWNLRLTLHASLAEDHMLMQRAFESGHMKRYVDWMVGPFGVSAEELAEHSNGILDALARGPMGRRELHEIVPIFKGMFMVGWGLDVMGLAVEGKVVISKQAAANTEFARMDIWAPSAKPSSLTETEALCELARRYFATYGPATFADFLYWSGLKGRLGKSIFDSVRPELTEVEVADKKGAHFLAGEFAPADTLPVRLLPKFDPLMMGYRDKSLFLPDSLRDQVFRKAGQVEAVILAEGQVRGMLANFPARIEAGVQT